MEPTELDPEIILPPAQLVITKQSLEVIQRHGSGRFEMYQLIGDVVGFELFRCPPSPPVTSTGSERYVGLLFLGTVFGALAYGARMTGALGLDFLLLAAISVFCLAVGGGRFLFPPDAPPGLDYGLRIKLASERDKLLLCASPKDVTGAIWTIYDFIHSGAYLSQVIVNNDFFGMMAQVERHTP